MTEETFKSQKARLEALIEEWHHNLGLGWWKVHHNYYDDTGYFLEEHDKHCGVLPAGSGIPIAFTWVSWEYLEASVYWNVPRVQDQTDEELEEMFVHECCHILLREMHAVNTCNCGNWDMRHEERVCTTFAKAFIWTKIHYVEDREKASVSKKKQDLPSPSQRKKSRG